MGFLSTYSRADITERIYMHALASKLSGGVLGRTRRFAPTEMITAIKLSRIFLRLTKEGLRGWLKKCYRIQRL
jgi:hypothetical protein